MTETRRPAISSDVQRQIFIEAGHRCSVCGTPFPLERAHIVPWSQTNDHSAENLICLCANCHERADRDWDAATLREYKRNPWVARQAPNVDVRQTQDVRITIDLEFADCDTTKLHWLQFALAGFLNTSPHNVVIKSVVKGSVHVNVNLPSHLAVRLIIAFHTNLASFQEYLNPLLVQNIELFGEPVFENQIDRDFESWSADDLVKLIKTLQHNRDKIENRGGDAT